MKERNMTNVEQTTYDTEAAFAALTAAESNLADAVYNEGSEGLELHVLAPTEEGEVFVQEDPSDAVTLN